MRNATPATAILMAVLSAGRAAADGDAGAALDAACVRPAWGGEPHDPSIATQEQMLEEHRSIKAYDHAVAAYGECLATTETRLVAAGGDAGVIREDRIQRNDGAVGDAEHLAAEFNTRVKAWRERQPAADFQPAKIIGHRTPPERCYPPILRLKGLEMVGKVTLSIDPNGEVSLDEWPVSVPNEQRIAFKCVVGNLRFAPATSDNIPVRSTLELPISFGLTDTADGRVKIESPSQSSSAEDMAGIRAECMPAGLVHGGESVIESTIGTSERVTRTKVVASSGNAAIDSAARCVMEKTRFLPGTRNGVPQTMTITSRVRVGTPASVPRGAGPPPATGTTPP